MTQRFSVSLDEALLEQFDDYTASHEYNNRSEAIRDLIRNALVQQDWAENRSVIGVISLVYDHSLPQVQQRITRVQHDSHEHIVSTTHIHVDHDNCLEVIIVNGKAQDVARLTNELAALRGVRNCSLSTTGVGERTACGHSHADGHASHVNDDTPDVQEDTHAHV